MIRELEEGKHGSGTNGIDMLALKKINKKLKKCRIWGELTEKKKSKKRKAESGE